MVFVNVELGVVCYWYHGNWVLDDCLKMNDEYIMGQLTHGGFEPNRYKQFKTNVLVFKIGQFNYGEFYHKKVCEVTMDKYKVINDIGDYFNNKRIMFRFWMYKRRH